MNVFGWQCDYSGCGHYRIALPFSCFADLGHEATWSGELSLEKVYENPPDVLVGQRLVLPEPSEWWQRTCREGRYLMVYEADDDYFNLDPTNPAARALFTPDNLENARKNLECADLVTVSTDYLAEVMSEHTTAPVVVLPNRVPRWLTEWEPRRSENFLTLGWAGSTSHAADWEELASEVRRFLVRGPGTELHVLGTTYARGWVNARHTGWQEDVATFLRSIDFHVGLAPLRASVFNRSKSALKALEYGALGIPTVASDFGPYHDYVEHGVTGMLVQRPHQWSTYLRSLALEPELREKMGVAAREKARENVIEDHAWRWIDAFEEHS